MVLGGNNEIMARADALSARATNYFKPRSPITTKDLFAGRWGELTTIQDSVTQPGLHVVIYGERGVGKTSLANVVGPTIWALDNYGKPEEEQSRRIIIKEVAHSGDSFSSLWHRLFLEIHWPDDGKLVSTREAFMLGDNLTIDDVRRVLVRAGGAVFIIDEFDQALSLSRQFTELIKSLQDLVAESTIVLVGVAETVDALIAEHASINRAVVQVRLERMKPDDLREILTKAEQGLQIKFAEDAASLIVHVSQGLPHYTHLIGLHAVRSAAQRFSLSEVQRDDVFEALKKAVKQAEQTVTERHSTATHSSHKKALYRHVLLACALAAARSHDSLGYFAPGAVAVPLSEILGRQVTIANFQNHLVEFCQPKHGEVLERDGQPWGYRYRFRNPLLVPYVFMDGVEAGITSGKDLVQMLTAKD